MLPQISEAIHAQGWLQRNFISEFLDQNSFYHARDFTPVFHIDYGLHLSIFIFIILELELY